MAPSLLSVLSPSLSLPPSRQISPGSGDGDGVGVQRVHHKTSLLLLLLLEVVPTYEHRCDNPGAAGKFNTATTRTRTKTRTI